MPETLTVRPEVEARIHPGPAPETETALVGAQEEAYDALLAYVHHPEYIGEHAGYIEEEPRVLTQAWHCLRPGYRGWYWTVTMARAPRSRKPTVDEVSLLPGDDSLLAPQWIPWDVRLEAAKAEIEERKEAEAAETNTEVVRPARRRTHKQRDRVRTVTRRDGATRLSSRSAAESGHHVKRREHNRLSATPTRTLQARRRQVVRGSRKRTYPVVESA
ncbi:DUF3027 domain-containing protein [Neoactinobaculum massilliense]|uniref:DUF3027 domain-containing protein n=1 Tax=Neoactinobaculum massilliense TaxID=2364794 RepID=UPI000F549E62|nr:DUF3027 domain-containing protein [Neoactinobaculum massilliense]